MSELPTEHRRFVPAWPVDEARARGLYLYRSPIESYAASARVTVAGRGEMLMFGGYSYLSLNLHPRIVAAAQEALLRYGTGTSGVRLLAGTLDVHNRLETRIARFKCAPAAVTFSSGYLANVSTIAAVVGRHDTVICDKLNHASILDGCALSGARLLRFGHNDMLALEARLKEARGHTLVIVDAVFSMDGDIADLPSISALCRRHQAMLMVDEAHAIGVLGRTGHGIEEHFGLPADTVDIKMGTLSKAIPSVGGYVAGRADLCEFLVHQSRGFIYSGALPPASAAAAAAAFDVIDDEPHLVARLHDNVAHFASALRSAGFDGVKGQTPIFPIICGDDMSAWEAAGRCQDQGVFVQAIPHPVVPSGQARLRVSVCAAHQAQDLDRAAEVIHTSVMVAGVPQA